MKTLNISYFYVFSSLFLILGCSKDNSDSPDIEEPDIEASSVMYVSPDGSGTKSGESAENAADFLDPLFWDRTRKTVLKETVEVQFLDGEYGRAYTEKPLVLDKIGHADNTLTLRGGDNVIFTLAEGVQTKSYVIDVRGAQNIVIDGLHFTGNGSINYVLRFTRIPGGAIPTTNITLQNSSFIDLEGVIYGASGCSYEETSHITYKNVTFKRVGVAGTAHMIYNAYGASNIHVIDCHFEDCMGDYVRFRDRCDYGIVKGSTFLKTLDRFIGRVFISMPQFNSREPVGDEYFSTNYAFVDNEFTNKTYTTTDNALTFYHAGFSPPEWKYLLNRDEGQILRTGSSLQKKNLLRENFGIDTDKVRMHNNTFSSRITRQFALITMPSYGAPNKGFSGNGDISDIFNTRGEPFDWEL